MAGQPRIHRVASQGLRPAGRNHPAAGHTHDRGTGPELIQTMLTKLGPSLDKGRFYEKMGQLVGEAVITVAGSEHTQKRRRLQPVFSRPKIASYVDVMRSEANAAIEEWVPGQAVDVREAMIKLSLDMLVKTVFAGSLDSAVFARLCENLSVILSGIGVRLMMPDWVERLPIAFNRRFLKARDDIRATIGEAIAALQSSEDDAGGMLSMLLLAEDEAIGRPLTDKVCSEVLTLALAGTETTATVLSWVLYELASRPEIEARVLTELDQILSDRPMTFDAVDQLPYLSSVITEALRLHHPGWIITRRTVTETRLATWTLPAGTELAYCQHALHRDPDLYSDPLTFNPDRWLDGTLTLPPGAFVPFGGGVHRCMGERLAMTEMITALATMLRRWRLELAPGQTVRTVAWATVRPRSLVMTVRPRKEE
ncbi:cytochrome P450 [Paraburkholderia elongata]|uniref:cytochrome P450 n=1 Tax=Paraburkholderia elongata TaxID=2675747 RepID=UPI002E2C0075|nr:cytochrome P450 [Paraburkholderia elongata]